MGTLPKSLPLVPRGRTSPVGLPSSSRTSSSRSHDTSIGSRRFRIEVSSVSWVSNRSRLSRSSDPGRNLTLTTSISPPSSPGGTEIAISRTMPLSCETFILLSFGVANSPQPKVVLVQILPDSRQWNLLGARDLGLVLDRILLGIRHSLEFLLP